MEKIKLLTLQDGGSHSGVQDTRLLGCYAAWTVNPLAPELFFLIIAHPVYKM